ncbi:unnamed protein product, partial [Brassica oleracea]
SCRVRSKIESGERPARECACRRRSLSNYRKRYWSFAFFFVSSDFRLA